MLNKEIHQIRRELHCCPEIAFQEQETTALINKYLQKWGLIFHSFKHLDTGGYATIGAGSKVLGFRADIDGLQITENPEHKIKSKRQGMMHACGHDYHIAIALGILRYFQQNPEQLKGKLVVLFQPGEEAPPGGAALVKDEPIVAQFNHILGIHVDPDVQVGKLSIRAGATQASSTFVTIQLLGPGGHTSQPQHSEDLIQITGEYITNLSNYLRRHIDPRENYALVFGSIQAGNAHNIIPSALSLKGTLRAFDAQVRAEILKKIHSFSELYAQLHSIRIVTDFPSYCPAVINDETLFQLFLAYLCSTNQENSVRLLSKSHMGTDDFSFYLEKIPGLYLQVGGGGNGKLHTANLNLDENLLKPAVALLKGFISYYFVNN
jgi:N-acetyldiaminopimelate deacetylase